MDEYTPLSTKELERGYYFLTHREQFKKIGLVALLGLVLVIYSILIINTVSLMSKHNFNDKLALISSNQIDWAVYHQSRHPQDVNTLTVKYLSLGQGKYNFIAMLENPNTEWAASEIEYEFTVNGQTIGAEKTFLNPGETRPVVRFGYEQRGSVSNIDLHIINTKWRRFENDVPIVNWNITDVEFTPTTNQAVGTDESLVIPANVKWKATNLSLYDFWEVDFIVAVFNGDNLVGINRYKARDFLSLEEREMEVFWSNSLSRTNKTQIWPVLNWLDFDNYKDSYLEPDNQDRTRL